MKRFQGSAFGVFTNRSVVVKFGNAVPPSGVVWWNGGVWEAPGEEEATSGFMAGSVVATIARSAPSSNRKRISEFNRRKENSYLDSSCTPTFLHSCIRALNGAIYRAPNPPRERGCFQS